MKGRGAVLGAAVCVLVASCSLDFVEPGPGSPVARLSIRLQLGMLANDSLSVDASLDPGVGADGVPSEVPDPLLRVLGRSLAPDSTWQDEKLRISWNGVLPTDPADPAATVIEAPVVSGRELPPPLPIVLRREAVGSRRGRTWTSGEDLVLPLLPAAGDTGLDEAAWNLAVRGWAPDGSTISLLTLVVHGPVGDTVRVPAAWLPVAEVDSLEARLQYTRNLSSAAADGSYSVVVTADQLLSWVLKAEPR